MSETPRLRSSYPTTPRSAQIPPGAPASSPPVKVSSRTRLQSSPRSFSSTKIESTPLIPTTLIDAPTQRFYVLALYILLLAWRLYDWARLVEDDAESFWLFLKWVATDGVFLYGLPGMRIPWLEWRNPVVTGLFLWHAIVNGMLMFRIPIPIEAGLAALVKTLYDREISVSEHRVKPARILQNSSLIMGKQIINVLPEGFASLNPDHRAFCIDNSNPAVTLSIRMNQTDPILIELSRLDFESNMNETITIKQKEINKMKKHAKKKSPKSQALDLEYVVKKTGLFKLHRVVDESRLEVQRRISDTLVVNCPQATIKPIVSDRCIGDLSDLTIDVKGVPPLKLVYSRTVNNKDSSFHFQSIQPENLVSPLLGSSSDVTFISHAEEDVSWGRSQSIHVRLNESMTPRGKWVYSIDEVHDATGNIANFTARREDGEHNFSKGAHLKHAVTVHGRPQVQMDGCDTGHTLRVAVGKSTALPIKVGPIGDTSTNSEQTITWQFTPIDKLTASGDHGDNANVQDFVAKWPHHKPKVSRPGLYTLTSVRNQFCNGEVKEPSSCLLVNPPEPDVAIMSENIYDKCAGSSIGLMVDLDLIGTPPFTVRYDVVHDKHVTPHAVQVEGLRHQLELKPKDAGHFLYRFTAIDDQVYTGHVLKRDDLILEQDVKPPAFAHFSDYIPAEKISSCIQESVDLDIILMGEPPFALEYELVHDGKRTKHGLKDIKSTRFQVSTGPLLDGGDYSLALASIQDKTGCKVFLNDQVKIEVRRQRPKVSFAQLDGKRSVMTLERKRIALPLRLEGEAPFKVGYKNWADSSAEMTEKTLNSNNAFMEVDQRGTYELVHIHDKNCPGTVDPTATKFNVDWIARPELKVSDSAGLTQEGQKYLKREICEGEVDTLELHILGAPPFHLSYERRLMPEQGSQSVAQKKFDVALGVATIPMDTSKAGLSTYEFYDLADSSYDHGKSLPLIVQQTVNSKPSARFTKPGQSYKYCKEEGAGDEIIPITLQGQPPFSLEIDIKHQSGVRLETVKIANIESSQYDFRIPHHLLSLGTHHVRVRKIRDGHGCQQKAEYGAPHVQVQVFDVPTIYPLESQTDYCVGDRISYTLSGVPPFDIFYTFEGVHTKAKTPNMSFRRIAEKPGEFIITAVSDKASDCKASTNIRKTIHELPSVKLSKGRQVSVDIHEGGEAEILFEFWGTPPFEFTYTRSTNARKNHKSQVLETRHDVSYEHSKLIRSSQEGTYEVVAIKDKYCAFSTQKVEIKSGQRLIQ
ncbi:MAG: hypothetical protein M1818_003126 [Claussenomyces sp. TS43310]|nr:MAG: hypothetical protein M1818_003126 [Claussenomyces sp. TS43310]